MKNTKLLVVVDESHATKRALEYVAQVASRRRDFRICLAHALPSPPPESARSLHFLALCTFIVFFIGHVTIVALHGFAATKLNTFASKNWEINLSMIFLIESI
jgi:hypothetical protein